MVSVAELKRTAQKAAGPSQLAGTALEELLERAERAQTAAQDAHGRGALEAAFRDGLEWALCMSSITAHPDTRALRAHSHPRHAQYAALRQSFQPFADHLRRLEATLKALEDQQDPPDTPTLRDRINSLRGAGLTDEHAFMSMSAATDRSDRTERSRDRSREREQDKFPSIDHFESAFPSLDSISPPPSSSMNPSIPRSPKHFSLTPLSPLNSSPPSTSVSPLPIATATSSSANNSSNSASSSSSPLSSSTDLPRASIDPDDLYTLFKSHHHLLLLDLRPRDRFEKGHIRSPNIANIDPLILRNQVDSQRIQNSLVLTSLDEQNAFAARDSFALVVIYDESSTEIPGIASPPSTDAHRALDHLFKAVYTREFIKPLQKPPLLLLGGWQKWQSRIGAKGIVGLLDDFTPASVPVSASLPSHNSDLAKLQEAGEQARRSRRKPVANGSSPTIPSPVPQTVQEAISQGILSRPSIPTKPAVAAQKFTSPDYRPHNPQFYHSTNHDPTPSPSPSISSNGYRDVRSNSTDYPHLPPSYPVNAPTPPPLAAQHHALGLRTRTGLAINSQNHRPHPSSPPDRNGYHSHPYFSPGSPISQNAFNTFLSWGDGSVGKTGLKNLGNTCYMNSTLQCLSATVPLARFFNDGSYKRHISVTGLNATLAHATANLVQTLWTEKYNFLAAIPFRDVIFNIAPAFRGTEQQDSEEFLNCLLNGLHEAFDRVRHKPPHISEEELEKLPEIVAARRKWDSDWKHDNSVISELFRGQLSSRVQCLTCHEYSSKYESFIDLSLEIPPVRHVTLDMCIEAYLKTETLRGEESWYCPRCKKLREGSKQLSLTRMPPILIIHLKRFHSNGRFLDKNDTPVLFPLDAWNVAPYLRQDASAKSEPLVYELYGVSNHFGQFSSGHYTAFVKNRDQWFNFDDSRFTPISTGEVSRDRNAYILFYRRAL